MDLDAHLIKTPWDARAIDLDTFQVVDASPEVLQAITDAKRQGHYTVRIEPLASKKSLHEHDFYYCDTLIEPYCTPNQLVEFHHENLALSKAVELSALLKICHGSFSHDRFHRDFNIASNCADIRYDLWLKDLYDAGKVFGLFYQDQLAGFLGVLETKLVLHALSENYRGQGLAKRFWSLTCHDLFQQGHLEVSSSISMSNTKAINLYASLGFRFRSPFDIYHRLIV